ncbi:hypothetical protein OB2597_11766 [Pseudooceanicola batsensis HTCC2597]|uniref:Permease n=1 Tax=Pseudooceanicola batsensis (strain ATCC BAA-863 / DSM 15984 / KCTC 12145 / HTCC2597) TaxID=252305 RepID=A3TWC3_PSEBH|nr:hypothetical protein [Pseudooceanicola batsensis]EAQ03919.1 hypothetical protein OB2597_11766 [Pseudooceanicola batsensis HTCC2597]
MSGPLIFIWGAVAILGLLVWKREGVPGLRAGSVSALNIGRTLMLRLPLALLAASFLALIIPLEHLSRFIGPESGVLGITLAALVGGLLPGGPMASFPIAIVFMNSGAGVPQMVALIGGWSVFALHRLLAYEAPIMGWRFIALRLGSSMVLPVIAGLIADLLLGLRA